MSVFIEVVVVNCHIMLHLFVSITTLIMHVVTTWRHLFCVIVALDIRIYYNLFTEWFSNLPRRSHSQSTSLCATNILLATNFHSSENMEKANYKYLHKSLASPFSNLPAASTHKFGKHHNLVLVFYLHSVSCNSDGLNPVSSCFVSLPPLVLTPFPIPS